MHSIWRLKAAANTSDSRINWDLNHTFHWEKAHRKRCSLLRMEAEFHTTLCGSKGDTVNHNVIRNHEHQAAKMHTHNRNLILKREITLPAESLQAKFSTLSSLVTAAEGYKSNGGRTAEC